MFFFLNEKNEMPTRMGLTILVLRVKYFFYVLSTINQTRYKDNSCIFYTTTKHNFDSNTY
jgi:hypothetical protein